MQIFINGINRIFTVNVNDNDSIRLLLSKINDKEEIKGKAMYGGKILDKLELCVKDYGIKDGSTLFLSYPLLGGGIPSYVRQIIEKHDDCHFWKDDMNVDTLLIDFNSIIYQVINILNEKIGNAIYSYSSFQYEELLLCAIVKQLQHVICKVIKPSKMVYIAMDGVPPRAKMVQQRARRYKFLKEQSFKESLEKRYKITIPNIKWNRNSISPGTTFMIKLSKLIIKNIKQKVFQEHNNDITVIFSDSSIPGEGEHKLLPSLRRHKKPEEITVIYSPDADLVVLSIMSSIKNIFILREPKNSDIENLMYKDNEFLYLSIDNISEQFEKSLGISHIPGVLSNNILHDYSFLTFFCGNDFVMAAPFLKMKEGGIQILIDCYNVIFNKLNSEKGSDIQYMITDNGNINMRFLSLFLKEISLIEEDKLKKWQQKRDRIRSGMRSSKKELNEQDKELWEIDLIRFNHEEYYSPIHPQYEFFNKVFDKIDYYSQNWNEQYNKHFFPSQDINTVCLEYFKSIIFCLRYYNEIPDWAWYYKYRAAPSIKQFYEFVSKNENIVIKWENTKPYSAYEQLMFILPRQSFYLLPKVLNIEKNIDEYYPKNFILDIVYGTKFIYSDPILPEIPDDIIISKLKNSYDKLSILEQERNVVRTKPFIY